MRIDGDTVKFRNGREEYANCGAIGLGRNGSNIVISGGYDDGFPNAEPLTMAERQELAEYMIIQWKLFGAKEII